MNELLHRNKIKEERKLNETAENGQFFPSFWAVSHFLFWTYTSKTKSNQCTSKTLEGSTAEKFGQGIPGKELSLSQVN